MTDLVSVFLPVAESILYVYLAIQTFTVFPTHVGVDRTGNGSFAWRKHRPHARGGGPYSRQVIGVPSASDLHTWGWTAHLLDLKHVVEIVPTPLGWAGGRRALPVLPGVVPMQVGVDR
jgi:hypothetical protein